MCCLLIVAALFGARALAFLWWLLDPVRWGTTFPEPLIGLDLDLVKPAGLEALEVLAFGGPRCWWGLDDLLASPERGPPHRLRDHLPDLVAGRSSRLLSSGTKRSFEPTGGTASGSLPAVHMRRRWLM